MKHAAHIHFAVQGALTVNAIVTLATHSIAPEIEAVAFCVSSMMAVWAADFERKVRHPKYKVTPKA